MNDLNESGPTIEIIIEVSPHDLRSPDGAFLIDEEEFANAERVLSTFNEAA